MKIGSKSLTFSNLYCLWWRVIFPVIIICERFIHVLIGFWHWCVIHNNFSCLTVNFFINNFCSDFGTLNTNSKKDFIFLVRRRWCPVPVISENVMNIKLWSVRTNIYQQISVTLWSSFQVSICKIICLSRKYLPTSTFCTRTVTLLWCELCCRLLQSNTP